MGRKKTDRPTSAALHVRSVPEWLGWVNELAAFEGLDQATEVELALRDRAKKVGFKKPAPRRTQPKSGPKPKTEAKPKPKGKPRPKKEGGDS